MNKEKYLAKIKKLLNLSKHSTNSNEAANAMSQAQNLMREHGLTSVDIDLMEINEAGSKGAPSHAQAVPKYMGLLADIICRAFGVKCYMTFKRNYYTTAQRQVIFYGPNERPQIAAYAFDVLSRQMMKARREYTASMRKSIKVSTKIARGDTFCEGWVIGAYQVIKDFTVTDTEATLITAYHRKLQKDIGLQSGDMREAKKCRGADDAAETGYRAGKDASLHHAVNGTDSQHALIGRS
ncbi:Protein of uncharacterised function (DUF2786) [Yersinia frederiksenii]|uniref:DUF2786 domain-containing protein n=1 Tax=Yersinia proxima TaxID=2890316 RepID=UPI0005E1FFA1|nr:DUF2786 domain-containing protein [Yersinia proxima]CNK23122.1 Protein of uncharacterised function (DUF2786) [Yersinia frederiksenii]